MAGPHHAHALSLLRFIDRSPSPYHVAEHAAEMLVETGFDSVDDPAAAAAGGPGRWVHRSDGMCIAAIVPDAGGPLPVRMIGAHTDSPNLRLKPDPDNDIGSFRRLGVEVYGGVLLNSWLDRDLGVSGRVTVRQGDASVSRLLVIDQPLLRIPQLAIHLDREINDRGLQLNRQAHLNPIYGLETSTVSMLDVVAERLEVSPDDLLGFDLMLHDVTPSTVLGLDDAFLSAPRLDNQVSCHAAATALAGVQPETGISMMALFDHEEVGSTSSTGAATATLGRIVDALDASVGVDRARSLFVSADNAHATHPNYPERHDPNHQVDCNGGPVLKFNSNQRYTTDAVSTAAFRLAAERAGVQTQSFVSRGDMPCGSTIGPTVAAALGMRALDVGVPQLAMHSARELAGAKDPWDLTLLLAELLG